MQTTRYQATEAQNRPEGPPLTPCNVSAWAPAAPYMGRKDPPWWNLRDRGSAFHLADTPAFFCENPNDLMEAYGSRTRNIIELFLAHKLSFPDCIAALDAALADFIPRLTGKELPALRALLLANNETVMKEMERRGPLR
jgi:hypothetical protein